MLLFWGCGLRFPRGGTVFFYVRVAVQVVELVVAGVVSVNAVKTFGSTQECAQVKPPITLFPEHHGRDERKSSCKSYMKRVKLLYLLKVFCQLFETVQPTFIMVVTRYIII